MGVFFLVGKLNEERRPSSLNSTRLALLSLFVACQLEYTPPSRPNQERKQ